MASKYCHECIRGKWKIDIKEVFSALGISQTWMKLLWAILYFIRGVKAHKPCAVRVLSMAIWRRKWFVRLHNFNSNSENYINPVDGMKTNLAPSGQLPTCEGRSRVQVETLEKEIWEERINQKTPTQDEFLLVPESDLVSVEQIFERFLNRKKRKMGTANSKRKFVTFNRLLSNGPWLPLICPIKLWITRHSKRFYRASFVCRI